MDTVSQKYIFSENNFKISFIALPSPITQSLFGTQKTEPLFIVIPDRIQQFIAPQFGQPFKMLPVQLAAQQHAKHKRKQKD